MAYTIGVTYVLEAKKREENQAKSSVRSQR